jgi:hypothetical protein
MNELHATTTLIADADSQPVRVKFYREGDMMIGQGSDLVFLTAPQIRALKLFMSEVQR